MPSFHVPSVSRSTILPTLDAYRAVDEDGEVADPTPAGSNWLFRPPPFISWASLQAETVTIHNPSAWRAVKLTGYRISDRLQRHTFSFPDGCRIRPGDAITLHCCPGKLSEGELDKLSKSALLWKNQDGSLRKKEVLNDDGDAVLLSDPRGKEVAWLMLPGLGDERSLNDGDGTGREYMRLPAVKRAQILSLRALVLTLCYLRLTCIAVSFSYVTVHPDVFALAALAAHAVDLLCRWASGQSGVPMDEYGVVLATLGDRLANLVLLGALAVLDGDRRHRKLFAGILALDFAASWLQLAVATTAGGARPLAGAPSVRGKGGAPDFATHLMVKHPIALTLISLGNEAFLLWSYQVASSRLAHGLPHVLRTAACFLAQWSCVRDEIPSCGSEVDNSVGEDPTGRGVTGTLQLEMVAVFGEDWVSSTTYKAVWMALMVCCAGRQLLSCIQALISMSTLSSGVIADAAGQDLQRCGARPSRGRSVGRANGGGPGLGNPGHARARSRSRVR